MNYVYAVLNSRTRQIKIGQSLRPEKRVRQLQTGAAQPLRLVGSVAESDVIRELGAAGAKGLLEELLHAACAKDRVSGEWFRESALVDQACAAIQAGPREVLWFLTTHVPIAQIANAVDRWKACRQC